MFNFSVIPKDLRFRTPETIWLEPEHFEQAGEISDRLHNEQQQWQAYLNALVMLAFAAWLKERLPNQPIQPIAQEIAEVRYLKVGEFKLCLMATEHVLDEVVNIPRVAIEQPELAAHFYVVLEVLEDQEEVIIRGFLRYDELTTQANRVRSSQSDGFYQLPLSTFDAELNHLLVYVQYSEPSAIVIPTALVHPTEATPQQNSSNLRTRLSQWLQGVLDEGWQTIDTLANPEANLAWSTRHTVSGAKGGKLINFGMQLGDQAVVLLVTVTPEYEGKIGMNVQVLPTRGAQILPTQLKLTLLSAVDKTLQEVQSREQDNYIQLKPFKGRPGTHFSIEVSLNNIKVREAFEL